MIDDEGTDRWTDREGAVDVNLVRRRSDRIVGERAGRLSR